MFIKFLLPENNGLFDKTVNTFWLNLGINEWQNRINRGQNGLIEEKEEIHLKEEFRQNACDIRILGLNHCQNLIGMVMKIEPETLFYFGLFTR